MSAGKYRNVGVERRDEISPTRGRHDLRRSSQRMAEAMRTPVAGFVTMFVFAATGAILPALADISLLLGIGFAFFIRSAQKAYTLPIKMPRHSKFIDPMELNPGNGKPMPAKGSFYLGNDRTTGEEVWLTNRDAGVHMLVLGTTGSGKTEMLLGICQNALNQGSGFMFVDGKAQDKIAFKIQDLCRARGRDDDVLILNFMTGARDIIGPQPNKITHTMNPFSYGSSGMVSQIVVGLMSGGGGGNDMWADRAISFVEALSPPLTYLRDHYGLILDVNEYRKYFELERIEELAWKGGEKYPGLDQVLDPMKNYIINLPGYDRNKFGKRGGQGDDTKLQHGYITMQLVRAFTSLADTYGHIVRVPLGEVDFPDLVKNRRILIVMLPSLEKTPSETANIGKIIVTAMRNIMAEGLGATLEGDRLDLENEDGRALLPPYVMILDEYGYYAVKGFAVAFAQARSLGFVCIVGGQDLASFQKESKEEAVSICGNTRIKAFGSIEDPEQTMKFVIETAGKTTVAETGGFEGEMGAMNLKFADNLNVHLKAVDRVDPTDVKAQIEGQFHFVWRDRVVRASTYYVSPKRMKRVQLNHFVQVRPPDQAQLEELEMASSGICEKLSKLNLSETIHLARHAEFEAAAEGIALSKGMGAVERGIAAVIHAGRAKERVRKSFLQSVHGENEDDAPELFKRINEVSAEASAHLKPAGLIEPVGDGDIFDPASLLSGGSSSPDDAWSQADSASDRELASLSQEWDAATAANPSTSSEAQEGVEVTPFEQMSVFVPIRPGASAGFGAEVFGSDTEGARRLGEAIDVTEDRTPMLNFDNTMKGIESLEIHMGATPDEAGAAAREVVQQIEDATRYPISVPKEKTGDQVADLLTDLLSELEEG